MSLDFYKSKSTCQLRSHIASETNDSEAAYKGRVRFQVEDRALIPPADGRQQASMP